MLMAEWKLEDALAFRFEEGIELGREEGIGLGREETARNALAEGASIAFVRKITGLDEETLINLQKQL